MPKVGANVLLRYLLRDDEAQAEKARRVFESGERILITDVLPLCSCPTLRRRRSWLGALCYSLFS